MPSYAAFIGHQPHVSMAELAATVPGFVLERVIAGSAILFRCSDALPKDFLNSLGGTVVLAEGLDRESPTLGEVPQILCELLLPIKGKVTFSLRTAGLSPHAVKDLYRDGKNILKKKGKPSRYVGTPQKPAQSIVLYDGELLDGSGGAELCILRWTDDEQDRFWMGRTVAAQDTEAYAARDMKKPVRDTTTGLLPPKLAQILINLGLWLTHRRDEKERVTVYDPFCGTGVIPMEALLRGFSVAASDKAEKAVTGCTKNLEWIRKTGNIKKSVTPSAVWKHDATKPFDCKKHPELAGVSVIVTETSLGPPLTARPTIRDAQKLRTENEALQSAFLENAAAAFPGVPVICTWPVWYTSKGPVFLEKIWAAADGLGYSPVLPPFMEQTEVQTADSVQKRMSLIYRRADHIVGREIVLLKPKKR